VEFNLSRTRHVAVVALATVEVGIDVEQVDIDDVDALAAVALTMDEQLCLVGDADRRATRFLRLWTAKEAYLKGTGVGLSADPRTVTFTSEPDGWSEVCQDGQPVNWRVRPLELGPSTVCSVAVEGSPRPLAIRHRPATR
jgi:4'-phosphopantetheinyl transferase